MYQGSEWSRTPAGAERSSAFSPMRYTACAMPVSRRYFAPGQLQFITSSLHRRLKLFDSDRLRLLFVEVLRKYRQGRGKRCQVLFPGRPRLRKVFSNPNCATAFDTHSFEPYGRLRWMAQRIFSISSLGCEAFEEKVPDTFSKKRVAGAGPRSR